MTINPLSAADITPRQKNTVVYRPRRRLRPAVIASFLIIGVYLFGTVFAGLIAPYGQSQIVSPVPFAPWNSEFLFGTDQLGRDVLSRLIYGAQNTVGIALLTTALSFTLGSLLGIFSAMSSGWIDQALSRGVDVLISIPQLIFALVLLAIFGTTMINLILIIAILDSTRVFRLSRSVGMNVAVMDFVEVARLRKESRLWTLVNEILPNVMPALVSEFGVRFCYVFLTIAALSFLGVGIQPPSADWGSMARETATLIAYGDMTPLLPAAAIAVLTVCINIVIDWYAQFLMGAKDEA